jgi:hypothetical protein
MFTWEKPSSRLPEEREWVVGSYDKDTAPGFAVTIVRRIGQSWFDEEGRPVDEPGFWTHRVTVRLRSRDQDKPSQQD